MFPSSIRPPLTTKSRISTHDVSGFCCVRSSASVLECLPITLYLKPANVLAYFIVCNSSTGFGSVLHILGCLLVPSVRLCGWVTVGGGMYDMCRRIILSYPVIYHIYNILCPSCPSVCMISVNVFIFINTINTH